MTTSIFIRSYRNDFEWLAYCLRSCQKFTRGFSEIVVAVPYEDASLLSHLTAERVVEVAPATQDGYLDQQITKLYADKFCTSDYVLHVDSDCIFDKDTTPEDFFLNQKPVILWELNVDSPWPSITGRSLGWWENAEYMRRMPIIYPRWIYSAFRDWMQEKHGVPLSEWIASQPFREFSEFNTLGQWVRRFHNEAFTWAHPSDIPPHAKQFWSWGGVNEVRLQIEKALR
jgi:hypothetical protein